MIKNLNMAKTSAITPSSKSVKFYKKWNDDFVYRWEEVVEKDDSTNFNTLCYRCVYAMTYEMTS